MLIVCHNCGWKRDTSELDKHNITNCPRCGAPLFGDGIGLAWVK